MRAARPVRLMGTFTAATSLRTFRQARHGPKAGRRPRLSRLCEMGFSGVAGSAFDGFEVDRLFGVKCFLSNQLKCIWSPAGLRWNATKCKGMQLFSALLLGSEPAGEIMGWSGFVIVLVNKPAFGYSPGFNDAGTFLQSPYRSRTSGRQRRHPKWPIIGRFPTSRCLKSPTRRRRLSALSDVLNDPNPDRNQPNKDLPRIQCAQIADCRFPIAEWRSGRSTLHVIRKLEIGNRKSIT